MEVLNLWEGYGEAMGEALEEALGGLWGSVEARVRLWGRYVEVLVEILQSYPRFCNFPKHSLRGSGEADGAPSPK